MGILHKIKNFFRNIVNFNPTLAAMITSRSHHILSRKDIEPNVLKVLYTLKQYGYQSYLVGGGVRDLLLGKSPKDFDVVTNAYPEKIKKMFKRSYIIGKRFQLVHVYLGKQVIEVATFRAQHKPKFSKEGMILRDNVYGKIEQDVLRRDFTINALYYNISDFSIVDYVGGLKDLTAKQICLIGDPCSRYREDPVRMLRAIRFAAKLDFKIHADTAKPLHHLGYLLLHVSSSRIYEEYVKLFFTGNPIKSYQLLKHYGLLYTLFPSLNHLQNFKYTDTIITKSLELSYENKIKTLNPEFLIAIILWYSFNQLVNNEKITAETTELMVYQNAAKQLLMQQNKIINLSKKIFTSIKDLWLVQLKFATLAGKPGRRTERLMNSAGFEQAFHLLWLRALSADLAASKIFKWWNKYVTSKGKIIT